MSGRMIHPASADALRRAELAKIHVAKKSLSLDDDAYRAILVNVTGKSSSSDLDWQGRQKLLEHFKKIGFKPVAKNAGRARPKVGRNRTEQMGKIEALLADSKLSWAYADGIAKKLFAKTSKIERIEFCDSDHLHKVIAALSYDAVRRSKKRLAAPDVGTAP